MSEILFLILGLVLILVGANILTDGAAALAVRFGLSEFMIGLTIIAVGTSAPELVVTIMSAAGGNSDVAVGNVLGSNLFNILMILGITALIRPVALSPGQIRRDIPFAFLAAAVLFIVGSDRLFGDGALDTVSRSEGMLLLCLFGVFMAYSIFSAPSPGRSGGEGKNSSKKLWLILSMIAAGLGGLIWGGDLFLDNAVLLARRLGVSESVIAITLMAGGTSLPELAACVAAALKNKGDLALGNVIGSNISNVFLILGTGAVIRPLTPEGITLFDLSMLLFASFLLFLTAFTFKTRRIDRAEGGLFILIYIGYVLFLIFG